MDWSRDKTPKRILLLRRRMKWTQDDLARELGCSNSAVRCWERGTQNPQRMVRATLEGLVVRARELEQARAREATHGGNDEEVTDAPVDDSQ